jgi:hypothetical protein
MPNKNSGGLVALTVALALVASLLYAQPLIRAYWWIAAAAARTSPRAIGIEAKFGSDFTG